MMDEHIKNQLEELLFLALEGEISDAQIQCLNHLIKHHPERIRYTINYLQIFSGLKRSNTVANMETYRAGEAMEPDYLMDSLLAMGEAEKTAPAVEIEKPMPESGPVKMLKIEKSPRVINKFSLYSAIISVAAMVVMLIYVKFIPPAALPVATIADSLKAQWSHSKHPTNIGERLWNNEGTRYLQKGTVKITFDYGAEVIIEGPAEFELDDPDEMILYSGRLYATVPKGATGFTVQTPCSTVIDLGTEFGIQVGDDGITDVHMFKGKASLIPGCAGDKREGQELVAGQARIVTQNARVKEIECGKNVFVREMDSRKGLLWRGQRFDLADVIGGGNGFGTGRLNQSINPDSGLMHSGFYWRDGKAAPSVGGYNIVGMRFIDGVFVPDGGSQKVQVSSQGHLCDQLPDTTGKFCWDIYNGSDSVWGFRKPLLNGEVYGVVGRPAVTMHSNAGITFDLDEIRECYPKFRIEKFASLCALTENAQKKVFTGVGSVEFFVVVDGRCRFDSGEIKGTHKKPVEIAISDADRFLTLIVTDGPQKDTGGDWAFFAEPSLSLSKHNLNVNTSAD